MKTSSTSLLRNGNTASELKPCSLRECVSKKGRLTHVLYQKQDILRLLRGHLEPAEPVVDLPVAGQDANIIFIRHYVRHRKIGQRFENASIYLNTLRKAQQVLPEEIKNRQVFDVLEKVEEAMIESTLFFMEDSGNVYATQLLDAFDKDDFTVEPGFSFLIKLIDDIEKSNKKLRNEIQGGKGSRVLRKTTDLLYELLCSLEWFSFSRIITKLFGIATLHQATALEEVEEAYGSKALSGRGRRPRKMVLLTLKEGEDVQLRPSHVESIGGCTRPLKRNRLH